MASRRSSQPRWVSRYVRLETVRSRCTLPLAPLSRPTPQPRISPSASRPTGRSSTPTPRLLRCRHPLPLRRRPPLPHRPSRLHPRFLLRLPSPTLRLRLRPRLRAPLWRLRSRHRPRPRLRRFRPRPASHPLPPRARHLLSAVLPASWLDQSVRSPWDSWLHSSVCNLNDYGDKPRVLMPVLILNSCTTRYNQGGH